MASGEMDAAEFTDFLGRSFRLLADHSADGAIHFVFMDWRHIGEIHSAGKGVYSDLVNVCVWVKPNAGMGSFYRSQHELVFVFRHGRATHRNNVQLGQYGRNRSNLWTYPGPRCFGRGSEEGDLASIHPTIKPVRLVAVRVARGEITADRNGLVEGLLGIGEPAGVAVENAETAGQRFGEIGPVGIWVARGEITADRNALVEGLLV